MRSEAAPLLQGRDLGVTFGGRVVALDGVDLDLSGGEILGIIGPNGSGKTTLLACLSGFLRPTRGRVFVEGQDMTGRRAHMFAARGIRRSFQHADLAASLTAEENVALALPGRQTGRAARPDPKRAGRILADLGYTDDPRLLPDQLSWGRRRMVELARVRAAEPRVALLDEPAAGLDDEEERVVAGLVRDLRDSGAALVIVSHRTEFLLPLADRVIVLHHGSIIAGGRPDEISAMERVQDAYLGVTLS